MTRSSRDIVLDRICAALATQRDHVEETPPAHWPPRESWTRPQRSDDDVRRFTEKLEAALCTVTRLDSMGELAGAVEAVLYAQGSGRDISIAPALRHVAWPAHWSINYGPGRRVEAVAITDAIAGIAETGSLVVCSHANRPASLNFLPDLHIAVVAASDVVAHMEDVWPKVRALPVWPRAVNIISAPSRTADVAQIVVRPAHGPKHLHVIVVGAAGR